MNYCMVLVILLLGQVEAAKRKITSSYLLCYQTLDHAQMNYAIVEKKFIAIVFAFEKFKAYLVREQSHLQ